MKRFLLSLLVLAGCCAPQSAFALLGVATCTTSAQAVAFGNYDPLATLPTDATGQVTVTCTAVIANILTSYTVALSTGVSGNYTARKLASGGNRLNYNLYKDPAHLLVWGNAGGDTVSGSFLVLLFGGASANHTVYGEIPARQNIAVGSYSDTITVTVTY